MSKSEIRNDAGNLESGNLANQSVCGFGNSDLFRVSCFGFRVSPFGVLPLIVGLGNAAELARRKLPGYEKKVRPLRAFAAPKWLRPRRRDALEEGILRSIPHTELNGHKTQRLASTTNITFHGVESEALLILLDQEGICASSGSACLADSDEPSHVVKAMKPDSAASRQMIRFSLGAESKAAETKTAMLAVQKAVRMLAA
jgi:cysteine desulfurase